MQAEHVKRPRYIVFAVSLRRVGATVRRIKSRRTHVHTKAHIFSNEYLSLAGMTSVITTSWGTPRPRYPARWLTPAADGRHNAVSPPTAPSFSAPSLPPRDGEDDDGGKDDAGLVPLVRLPSLAVPKPVSPMPPPSPVPPPLPRTASRRQRGKASCGSCLREKTGKAIRRSVSAVKDTPGMLAYGVVRSRSHSPDILFLRRP